MLMFHLFFMALVVQGFAKKSQMIPPSKRKSPYMNMLNVECHCVDETFCKFEQCRLKAVRRNEAQLFLNVSYFHTPLTSCKVNIDFYRKYTAYNPFPINFTVDACGFLENTHKLPLLHNLHQMLVNNSNLNHTCPYYEKNTLVQNLSATYTPFFSFVPSGSYIMKTRWYINMGTSNALRIIINLWFVIQNPENIFFGEGF